MCSGRVTYLVGLEHARTLERRAILAERKGESHRDCLKRIKELLQTKDFNAFRAGDRELYIHFIDEELAK